MSMVSYYYMTTHKQSYLNKCAKVNHEGLCLCNNKLIYTSNSMRPTRKLKKKISFALLNLANDSYMYSKHKCFFTLFLGLHGRRTAETLGSLHYCQVAEQSPYRSFAELQKLPARKKLTEN